MAFNGAGTFTRDNGFNSGSSVWATDASTIETIESGRHDTHDQDIASGLSNCLTKDGQTTVTANLPMAGFNHTNVGAATARTHYARASQVQDSALTYAGDSTGAANVYNVTLAPTLTAYVAGLTVTFKAHQTNTTSCSLNINGVSATAFALADATAFKGGEIVSGSIITAVYSSVSGGRWVIIAKTPGVLSWVPTISAGVMTYNTLTTVYARYHVELDGYVSFELALFGTTSGTPANVISASLPAQPTGEYRVFSGMVADGANQLAFVEYPGSGTAINASKIGGANFGLGTGRYIVASGRYPRL